MASQLSTVSETSCSTEEQKNDVPEIKDCSICYKSLDNTNMIITPCSHSFCNECFFKWLGRKESCAMCRRTLLTNEQVEEREHLLDEINEDVAREFSILNQTRHKLKKKKKHMEKVETKTNDLMDRQIRLRQMLDHTRTLCIDSMNEHEKVETELSDKKTTLKLMSSYRKEWKELYGKDDEKLKPPSVSAGEMKTVSTTDFHQGRTRRGRNTRQRFSNDPEEPLNSFISIETALANIDTETERMYFNNDSANTAENQVVDLTHTSSEEEDSIQEPLLQPQPPEENQVVDLTHTSSEEEDSIQEPLLPPPSPPPSPPPVEEPEPLSSLSPAPPHFSFDWSIDWSMFEQNTENAYITSTSITPPPMEDYESDSDVSISSSLNDSVEHMSLTPQYSSAISEEKQSEATNQFTLAMTTPLPNDSSSDNSSNNSSNNSSDNSADNNIEGDSMFRTPPRRGNSVQRAPGAPLRVNIPPQISNFFDSLNLNLTPEMPSNEVQQSPENMFIFGAPENMTNSESNTSSPPPPHIRRRVVVRRNRNRINSRHRISFHSINENI